MSEPKEPVAPAVPPPDEEEAFAPPEAIAPVAGPEDYEDPIARRVAILIMLVTLLGAIFAFLQTQAGDRGAAIGRISAQAGADLTTSLETAGRTFLEQSIAFDLANDANLLDVGYRSEATGGGPAAGFAARLAAAAAATSTSVSTTAKELVGHDVSDFRTLYIEHYRPAYAAAELQKAFGRQAGGWGAKGDAYITIITVFAVALFLLGLTLTVPAVARRPFLVIGTAVAVVATVWGTLVLARPVQRPSIEAIEAYAEGAARFDVEQFNQQATAKDYAPIISNLTTAIRARPDFREAYLARGSAYFALDLFVDPTGPKGSRAARNDWQRASDLDPTDFVARLDLGAADFWLGDYRSAQANTEAALAIRSDEPISNMNEALFLLASGDQAAYGRQLTVVRRVLASIPSWLRAAAIDRYAIVIDKGIRFRPQLAGKIRILRADLLKIAHEIDVSEQFYDNPNPKPVTATASNVTFALSPDRTQVRVTFDYAGMAPNQSWLYRTYVNRLRNDNFSIEAQPFTYQTPDGSLVLTFTDKGGFPKGQTLRTEIFVEGNMVAAGDTTVP